MIYHNYMRNLKIKELLEDENIKPEELAKMLGISGKSKVYEWMRGEYDPSIENIIKMAEISKCSIEYFIGRTEENSQTKFKKCPPFDEQLNRVMKQRRKTKSDLINDGIVNPSHFHRWFKLKASPRLETLIKLADYLQVSIDYLVGRE